MIVLELVVLLAVGCLAVAGIVGYKNGVHCVHMLKGSRQEASALHERNERLIYDYGSLNGHLAPPAQHAPQGEAATWPPPAGAHSASGPAAARRFEVRP